MIDAWIGNLGKYNEGELVGEWVSFPTDSKTMEEVFEKIGINEEYEEFFIADYDLADTPSLSSVLGEYPSLEELNYLALTLEKLEQDDLEKFEVCIDSGVASVSSVADAINLAENMDCYVLNSDIEDKYDLGYYYVHEIGGYDVESMGALSNYIDYEAFGRDIAYEQIGEFTSLGYIEEVDRITEYYHDQDDILDEDRLFSLVEENQNDYLKNTELSTEQNYNQIDGVRNNIEPVKEEKPSILERLQAGKNAVKEADQQEKKANPCPTKSDDCR